jgi:hypothetical protein
MEPEGMRTGFNYPQIGCSRGHSVLCELSALISESVASIACLLTDILVSRKSIVYYLNYLLNPF